MHGTRSPGLIAALDGAHVVFVSSASPARGAFETRRRRVDSRQRRALGRGSIRDIAEEQGVFVTLASLVGSEGGRMFQGGSMVMGPRGDTRAHAPVFEEALLTATIDLDDITQARADWPLLSDMRTMMPMLTRRTRTSLADGNTADDRRCGCRASDRRRRRRRPPQSASTHTAGSLPLVRRRRRNPRHPAAARNRPGARRDNGSSHSCKDEFARRGFKKAVVGLSGGVDSAVVATLAARALGPKNVIGVRMPYRTSSADSLAHAQLVIDALGIDSRTLDISAAVDGYLAQEPDADAARRGNVMARMRMIALFDLSAKHHALPLGTGNKSERLLGYFTWHADDSPPVNPIGDLFKTQLWALARHLGVPEAIIEKPASADLVSGRRTKAISASAMPRRM